MAVAVDSTTITGSNNMTSISSTSITDSTQSINSSSTMLLACLMFGNGASAPSGISITANSVSMTPLTGGSFGTSAAGNINYFWLNSRPATGTLNLAASWTGATSCYIWAAAFTGANLTGDTTTFANFTTNSGASSSPATVTIPTTTGNFVIAGHQQDGGSWITPSGTLLSDSIAQALNGAANYSTGSGSSVVLSYSYGSPASFISAGVNVVASGVADILQAQIWL